LFVLAGEDYWQGILALLFGWFGFTEGIIPFIAWFANHAWVLGLIQVGRRKFKYGGYMALIALGLASTTFIIRDISINEGGGRSDIYGLGPFFSSGLLLCFYFY